MNKARPVSFSKKRKALALTLILGTCLLLVLSHLFRVKSNIEYAFRNDGALLISTSEGYKSILDKENKLKFKELHKDVHVAIQSIKIRRSDASFLHKIENLLNPNKIFVFEFPLNNEFALLADIKNDLDPIHSREALGMANANFVLNTNFYGSGAIGEVIISGKRFGYASKASGFFKVIDGKPVVGARSLFQNYRGKVVHSCQAYPSVMKNGILFPYIVSETRPYSSAWKNKTYRNLLGTLPNGNLVCVVSNSGALLSVKEIAVIAQAYGVTNASLFDGGAALQYEYKAKGCKIKFSALNNRVNFGKRVDQKFLSAGKTHFPTKSPVFLSVKHLPAE